MQESDLKKLFSGLKKEINGTYRLGGASYSDEHFKGYMLATVTQLKESVGDLKKLNKESNTQLMGWITELKKEGHEERLSFASDIRLLNDFKAQAGVYIIVGSGIVALAVTIVLKVWLGV